MSKCQNRKRVRTISGAGNIKGITIELGGNTTKLQSALKDVNSVSRDLNKQLKEVEKSLKFNPGNVELVAQKQRILSEAIENTKNKLDILKTAQEQAAAALANGDLGQEKYDALTREILKTENQLKSYESQLSGLSAEEIAAAQASEQRSAKLSELSAEQEKLQDSAEKLSKSYDLQVASLGNNASESDKLKARQEYLKAAMENTAEQTKNLEQQLELAKTEYGANSSEANKLEKELLDVKLASREFANEYANVGSKLQEVSGKFAKASEGLNKAGNAFTLGLTAPIVAGAGLSIKAASDFQSAFAGVMKTVDEVVDSNGKVVISYADLEKGIRDMSKELPKSAAEISGVAEAAGQLGIKTESVLSFTETMIAMGEATDMSADVAATSLAQLANITGMSQNDFDKLGSSIVNLGNNMATTESNIVAMGLRLAGTGTQIGLTEHQLMAMAAAMSSVGIEAQAGGGSMSRVMQKINTEVLSSGKKLEGFAQIAGKSASEFAEMWKTEPQEAIIAFVKGLDEIKKAGGDVTSALKELGINSTQEIDTLGRLAGANQVLADAMNISKEGWEENIALTEEAEKRYATFESQLQIFKNKINDIGISIGKPLLEAATAILQALEPVINKIGELAQSFADADPKTQKMIMGFVALLAAIGPVLKILGLVASVVSVVTNAFAILTTGATATSTAALVLSKVFSGLATVFGVIKGAVVAVAAALSLPVGAVVAIGAAIAGLVALVVIYWDEIKAATASLWESLIEVWNGIRESFMETWTSISTFFSEMWTGFTEIVSSVWETIKNTIQVGIMFIAELFTMAVEIITLPFRFIWENCKEIIMTAWESIKSIVSTGINAVSSVISTVMNTIKSIISSVWNAISSTISSVLNSIKSVVSSVWNAISSVISSVLNSIKSVVSSAWNSIQSTVSSVLNSIKSVVSSVWNAISSTISSVINTIKSTISSGFNAALSTVTSIFESIKSKIQSVMDGAASVVKSAIEKIKGFFKFSWSLPKLKLPHISISGKFSLNPPSVPKFGISWYKDGAIFQNPTLFNTPYGVKGVGEAGPEAVLPIEKLSGILANTLTELGFNGNNDISALIPLLENLSKPINIVLDGRTIVQLLAPLMSEQIEFLNKRQLRGEGIG